MLNEKQLAEAVEKGIISDAQFKELKQLSGAQSGTSSHQDDLVAQDEAPRFFRSFNDIFIGLGVGILGYALHYASSLFTGNNNIFTFIAPVVAAGIFWLLGEWLTARRRINFPSIIISLFFTYFCVTGLMKGYELFFFPLDGKTDPLGVITVCGLASALIGSFFARFKLPFSVLLFAGSIAVFVISILLGLVGSDAIEPYLRWIILAIGLSVFSAAMWFDMQDPLRSKRTSDQGFWLHLLAAPIITHSVLWSSLEPLISAKSNAPDASSANLMVIIVLCMFVLFSSVALVIDRRAMLISSLGYAAAALGYIIYKFNIEGNVAMVITLVLIASLILTLGTGWYSLRKWLFSILPKLPFFSKLPPVIV